MDETDLPQGMDPVTLMARRLANAWGLEGVCIVAVRKDPAGGFLEGHASLIRDGSSLAWEDLAGATIRAAETMVTAPEVAIPKPD